MHEACRVAQVAFWPLGDGFSPHLPTVSLIRQRVAVGRRGMLDLSRRRELFSTVEINPAPPGKPNRRRR